MIRHSGTSANISENQHLDGDFGLILRNILRVSEGAWRGVPCVSCREEDEHNGEESREDEGHGQNDFKHVGLQ
jgi:hypothetical protein